MSGIVQGVGFRFFVAREARQHGVAGFVRNLRDGRVEAELEGDADAVDRLLDALRRGPAGARVEAVEVEELAPIGATGFDIRR